MARRSHKYDYDLISIGSGAGGGVAAHIAARDGFKVAVIEGEAVGGECPNFGCVPTKALLSSASVYNAAKSASDFGVSSAGAKLQPRKIKAWKDLAVQRTGAHEGSRAFSADGIDVVHGRAHFIDAHSVSVGKKRLSSRYFLVATGAHNFIPPVEGLIETGFITYRDAINLTSWPRSIFIIGGGPIGLEFAWLFHSFESKVSLAELAPRLLVREDKEVGELMEAYFKREGIEVMTATEVTKVSPRGGKKLVEFKSGQRHGSVVVDEVMVAAGMHPNTDLGLENAGVIVEKQGIRVNPRMQTSARHIYAAGDVVGPYGFTHMASYQSRIAAHNMFNKPKVVAKYHAVPRVVFTDPEIATVGMTEEQLAAKGIRFKSNAVPIDVVGKSNVTGKDVGFVKVLASHTGVLLGASIVSPSAGEMIHELGLAVNLGLKADDVASTIHAFPTWSEAVRTACAGLS